MRWYRVGEFSTGRMGNFQPVLTHEAKLKCNCFVLLELAEGSEPSTL